MGMHAKRTDQEYCEPITESTAALPRLVCRVIRRVGGSTSVVISVLYLTPLRNERAVKHAIPPANTRTHMLSCLSDLAVYHPLSHPVLVLSCRLWPASCGPELPCSEQSTLASVDQARACP